MKEQFSLGFRRERVLVAHLLRDGLRIQPYALYRKRGIVRALGTPIIESRIRNLTGAFGTVRKAIPFSARFFKHSIVFLLDPGLATSVYGAVNLEREHSKDPIVEPDIENMISQGIWKMFDRERVRAALKMGVREVDLILSDVRVEEVRLDNHRVLDPRGFTARTMSVRLIETLLPASLLDEFHAVFPKAKNVYFTEGGGVNARSITLGLGVREAFLYLEIFSAVTDVFAVHGDRIAYVDTLPWGVRDFERNIAEAFSVSETIAREMIARSITNRASPHFLRRMEKILLGACDALAVSLEKAVRHESLSDAYVEFFAGFDRTDDVAERQIPQVIFSGHFRTRSGERVRFLRVGRDGGEPAGEEDGGITRSAWDERARSALSHFFFSPSDDTLNKVARRRARWLREALEKHGEEFYAP